MHTQTVEVADAERARTAARRDLGHGADYRMPGGKIEPRRLDQSAILHLQATAGNAAVADLLGHGPAARRHGTPRAIVERVTDRHRPKPAQHENDPVLQRAPAAVPTSGKTIEIAFYAFIPDFKGHAFSSYSHQKGLKNQTAFDAAVASVSGTWLPEPGSVPRNSEWYFETDERGFGGGSHRVGFRGTINSAEIGRLMPTGRTVFTHDGDPSTRVKTVDTGYFTSTNETGSLDGPHSATAPKYHEETVEDPSPNKTTIWTSGRAAYAFMPTLSPNIDYDLAWIFEREPSGQVGVSFRILHDLFPCYEVIVNGTTLYSYPAPDPGPTLYNLNTSTSKTEPKTLF